MRAFRIVTGRLISPFAQTPPHAQFAETTLGQDMRASFALRGMEIEDVDLAAPLPPCDEPVVVFADHCFVTEKCLGDFLSEAFGCQEPQRLALCQTPASDYTRPVSSVQVAPLDATGPGARPAKAKGREAEATHRLSFDLFFLPKGAFSSAGFSNTGFSNTGFSNTNATAGALLDELRRSAQVRVVAKKEISIPVRMPLLGDPERVTMLFPITSTVAAHVEHWVHVLWLNQLAFGIRWNEIARRHKLWCIGRLLRTLPPSMPRLMRNFVREGKNVKIHPSAHVEASILGDNVVIGARASVRNCILAPGVEIGDHASVIASTLGEGAYVTPKSFLIWSTAYPDAVISNYKMQMSVVGRGAASSTWAGLIDAKFQGAIDVMIDGQKRSTERSFLGSCLGPGAYIGAKVLLLPGREIPPGTLITMRPDELIGEIPTDLKPGVPMVRHAGTLVPLKQLLPARKESVVNTTESSTSSTA